MKRKSKASVRAKEKSYFNKMLNRGVQLQSQRSLLQHDRVRRVPSPQTPLQGEGRRKPCHPEEWTFNIGEKELCSGSNKMLNREVQFQSRRSMLQHDKDFYKNNEKNISSKEGEIKMYKEIQNLTKVITTEFAGAVKEGKSYHLTPDPSPEIGEGRKITSPHPQPSAWFLPINVRATAAPLTPALWQKSASLTKFRNCVAHSYGFTLAETLITVVILGILAAILVPNLIKNQVENANRTKVKKAMATYEKAINYMIIENDIKSSEALRELGQDNCQYTKEYFKTVQDGENNCIFKTADRVWWDITDITNPILILKDSQLEKSETELKTLAKNVNDNTTFAMVGRFDDLGTLRINDNAYEQGLNNNMDNKKYMAKLWYFITLDNNLLPAIVKCLKLKQFPCEGYNVIKLTAQTVNKSGINNEGSNLCIYDREKEKQICGEYISNTTAGEEIIYKEIRLTSADLQNQEGKISNFENDYYQAAINKCKSEGGSLPTLAQLKALQSAGKLVKTGNIVYFATEEFGHLGVSGINGETGEIYNNLNKGYNRRVICVGND